MIVRARRSSSCFRLGWGILPHPPAAATCCGFVVDTLSQQQDGNRDFFGWKKRHFFCCNRVMLCFSRKGVVCCNKKNLFHCSFTGFESGRHGFPTARYFFTTKRTISRKLSEHQLTPVVVFLHHNFAATQQHQGFCCWCGIPTRSSTKKFGGGMPPTCAAIVGG